MANSEFSLTVELAELRTIHPESVRLFRDPRFNDNFTGSSMVTGSKKLNDEKCGISERRTGFKVEVKTKIEGIKDNPFDEADKSSFDADFIGNQSTFKALLGPSKRSFQAVLSLVRRIGQVPKQVIKITLLTADITVAQSSVVYQSPGPVIEQMLSTTPSTDTPSKLFGIYNATLTRDSFKNGSKKQDNFKISYTSEIDGLWYSDELSLRLSQSIPDQKFEFTESDIENVVEIKSLNTLSLYPWNPTWKHKDSVYFHYEMNVLRNYWIQASLMKAKKILCAVVKTDEDVFTLQEMMLYDVGKIPRVVQDAKKTGKLAVPMLGIFTEQEKSYVKLREKKNAPKAWTPASCYRKMYGALDALTTNLEGVNTACSFTLNENGIVDRMLFNTRHQD